MPEGRVLNTSTTGVTLIQEYIITDQQGNARLSFRNNGSNMAIVTHENSYYGFGLILANSPVGTTATSNKQLYNSGSECQNDYSNLPDYQQTYFRNYDAALARWVGVDPEAEYSESLSIYHYSGNNPIMFNDPLGNKAVYPMIPAGPYGAAAFNMTLGHTADEFDAMYANAFPSGGGDPGAIGGFPADLSGFWAQFSEVATSYVNNANSQSNDVDVDLSGSKMESLYYNYLSCSTPTSVDDIITAIQTGDNVLQPIFGGDGLLHTSGTVGVGGTDTNITMGRYFHGDGGRPITIDNGISGAFWGVNSANVTDIEYAQIQMNVLTKSAIADDYHFSQEFPTEMVLSTADHAGSWTIAAAFAAKNSKLVTLTGTTALEVVGDLTGATMVVKDGFDAARDLKEHKYLAAGWDVLKGFGTAGFLIAGLEEERLAVKGAEMLWNLGTSIIDDK